MNRRRRRLFIALAILALLIAVLAVAYINYRATRSVGFGLDLNQGSQLAQPDYMYSFAGSGANRLSRPLGVLVDGGRVYVTDSRASKIYIFSTRGRLIRSFGTGKVLVPLYIAKNPKTGELWVTDRRLRSIEIFDREGKWLRRFNPKLPKSELPEFESGKVQWAPVALAFAPDGTLYVTELLNGHRLLVFNPDGTFKRSTGTMGQVTKADAAPDAFMFPNNVKVLGNEVWVADSNNRRLKVYDRNGEFKKYLPTSGLPRGIVFLPKEAKDPRRIVVVDTLAHDVTIWEAQSGKKVLTFGQHGVLEGQFSYPNDVSSDGSRRMFIADTANGRIQVWGWPSAAAPIPTPRTPLQWLLCFAPLLLLPLLLLLRRRKFFATADFLELMFAAEEIKYLPGGKRKWFVTPDVYEAFEGRVQGDIKMSELLHPMEHSESDVKALMDRYEIDYPSATVLSLAQRSRVFCTEDPELRRLARVVEVDVVNRVEYIERFVKEQAGSTERMAGGTPDDGGTGEGDLDQPTAAEDTPPPPDIGENA